VIAALVSPAVPAIAATMTIEDTSVGTGLGQVSYSGIWTLCGGCVPATPNGSFRYSNNYSAIATIRFSGTQINIYGIKESHGGFAAISIDGGTPSVVDTFATTSVVSLIYSSGALASGTHTATLTNLHQRNPASDAYVVGFDRAVATTTTTPPPPPTPTAATVEDTTVGTGNNQVAYGGTWYACGGCVPTSPWPGRLMISIPPYPTSEGNANARCAAGAFDSYWREFGKTLNSYGRQSSFLRVGWESNGDWYPWSGTNPTDYINCWRHVVDGIQATAEPDPTMCWCLNNHYSQNPPSHNALDLYPGDAWVDGIGVDAYDHYPPSHTKAEFDAQANDVGGISYFYNFARAHNKFVGIGEWGVASGSGSNGGGDSPNYVQWMHDWFVDHAGKGLAYEFYFNNCEPDNVGSNLYRPLGPDCAWVNPNAAERYRQLW